VGDITKEYQEAAAVVIPVYHGAGSSIKFVEAMLMKRPVVPSLYPCIKQVPKPYPRSTQGVPKSYPSPWSTLGLGYTLGTPWVMLG